MLRQTCLDESHFVTDPDTSLLQKKKFEIGALTQKFTFYTGDDEKAKHLFLLCKDIHMFTQTLKERLAEIKQNSYEGEP